MILAIFLFKSKKEEVKVKERNKRKSLCLSLFKSITNVAFEVASKISVLYSISAKFFQQFNVFVTQRRVFLAISTCKTKNILPLVN